MEEVIYKVKRKSHYLYRKNIKINNFFNKRVQQYSYTYFFTLGMQIQHVTKSALRKILFPPAKFGLVCYLAYYNSFRGHNTEIYNKKHDEVAN